MDVAGITSFIQNLGFPIACVIALFYVLNREREDHKAESEKWTEAIHNNTIAMIQLTDYIKNNNKDRDSAA